MPFSSDKGESQQAGALEPDCLKRHRRWLWHVLVIRSGDNGAVGELFQELTVATLREVQKPPFAEPSSSWLYTVAVRLALLHRRKLGRNRKHWPRIVAETVYRHEVGQNDPLALLIQQERQELVRMALSRLHPKDREILTLKYTEDWRYTEISNHLGITEAQVTMRLFRARGQLRNLLATNELSEVHP